MPSAPLPTPRILAALYAIDVVAAIPGAELVLGSTLARDQELVDAVVAWAARRGFGVRTDATNYEVFNGAMRRMESTRVYRADDGGLLCCVYQQIDLTKEAA
jgi:hypothetical protein